MAGDFSEWGGGGGISSAIGDLNTLATTSMHQQATLRDQQMLPGDLQLQRGKLAQQPAELFKTLAETRQLIAKAGLEEQTLEQVGIYSKALKAFALGEQNKQGLVDPDTGVITPSRGLTPPKPSEVLLKLSNLAGESGYVSGMIDMAGKATTMSGHESADRLTKAREAEHQHQIDQGKMDWLERNTRMFATSPQGWANVNEQYRQKFGEFSPFSGVQWTPDLSDELGDYTLSFKQKKDQEFKDQKQDDLNDYRDSNSRLTKTITEINKTVEKIQGAQNETKAKSGGKPYEPTKASIQSIVSMAREDLEEANPDLYKGANKQIVDRWARDVASVAQDIRQKNRTIEPGVAESQAYQQMKGALLVVPGKAAVNYYLSPNEPAVPGKVKYDAGGTAQNITKTTETTVALPSPSDRVQDKTYTLNGRQVIWDPKGDPGKPWRLAQ